jgi:hypothetical protein
VEADLHPPVGDGLDETRTQALVDLGLGAVSRMVVADEDEERRANPGALLEGDDAVEAPVRVGSANAVEWDGGQRTRFVPFAVTQASARSADPAARPAPGNVDIVCERNSEAGPGPTRRLQSEALSEPLDGWLRDAPRGVETSVGVPLPVSLLNACQVVEGLSELVAFGALPAFDLLPSRGVELDVLPEGEVATSDRIEHPARAAGDRGRRRRSHPRDSRRVAAGADPSHSAACR